MHYRIPSSDDFEPASEELTLRLSGFFGHDRVLFIGLVGIEIDEVRAGWARSHLDFRPELLQAGGLVNGGVYCSMLDFAPVPALAACFDERRPMATLDMHTRFHAGVTDEDLIATGWVNDLKNTVAFTQAAVTTTDGRLIATASHTFKIGKPRE